MLQKGVFYFCFHYFTKTHTNFDAQKHMCVGNGVNIFRIWYCSTCSSIVRFLNCANVIIKIGMISYGKSRFLVFQIILIIIPPIIILIITYHCVVWNELWFIYNLRLCLLKNRSFNPNILFKQIWRSSSADSSFNSKYFLNYYLLLFPKMIFLILIY